MGEVVPTPTLPPEVQTPEPGKMTLPPEIVSPFEEARPAVETPPEKVEVPVPKRFIIPLAKMFPVPPIDKVEAGLVVPIPSL